MSSNVIGSSPISILGNAHILSVAFSVATIVSNKSPMFMFESVVSPFKSNFVPNLFIDLAFFFSLSITISPIQSISSNIIIFLSNPTLLLLLSKLYRSSKNILSNCFFDLTSFKEITTI